MGDLEYLINFSSLLFMRHPIIILLFIFLAKDCFSQKELCINKVSSGRIIVFDLMTDVYYKLKSDPAELSKDANDLSSVKIGKEVYRHGLITRMTDTTLVINREISKGKNRVDTIRLDQFNRIGKYRTGKGQKIIGGVLGVSSILFFATAIKEQNKERSPSDNEERTAREILNFEMGALSFLGSVFCFIYPVHKEFVLGEKWNLTVRQHVEQN